MSEHIDNQSKRQQILKGVIRQLHEGKSVDEVKAAFAQLLGDVGAGEIAAIEQALIEEGMPEDEIKRLCDVHVAVFRDSLETQVKPETIPGHPVYTFQAENTAVGPVLDALQGALAELDTAPGAQAWARAQERLRELREYEAHYLREENVLFSYLERHGFSGPSSVMWAIHDDVRAAWKELGQVLEAGPGDDPTASAAQAREIAADLDNTIKELIYKEENILFPTAMEKLSEQEWLAHRDQEGELGYSYVEPGSQWPAQALPPAIPILLPSETEDVADDLLQLDTGAMTASEVNRLLRHLPVDITYVDKDDRVRYFSLGRERIFPRSPAIIGRRVQRCHPPASVHQVQLILDDFRAGRREQAEFWIQMGDKFIHINYYALRDENGDYQGTLEVTQEVSHIRSLEGERRLLDDR